MSVIGVLAVPEEVRTHPGFAMAALVEDALRDLGWRVLGFVSRPGEARVEYLVDADGGIEPYSEGAIVEAWVDRSGRSE